MEAFTIGSMLAEFLFIFIIIFYLFGRIAIDAFSIFTMIALVLYFFFLYLLLFILNQEFLHWGFFFH